MSIIAETTVARTYEEVPAGDIYTLSTDHAFWRDPADELTQPISVFEDTVIELIRKSLSGDEDSSASIYRIDIYDKDGRRLEVSEKKQHFPAWEAALAEIEGGRRRFDHGDNAAVRVGDLTVVNRGMYFLEKVETVDGVEMVTYLSRKLILDRERAEEDAAIAAFRETHGDVIEAARPTWSDPESDYLFINHDESEADFSFSSEGVSIDEVGHLYRYWYGVYNMTTRKVKMLDPVIVLGDHEFKSVAELRTAMEAFSAAVEVIAGEAE